jgi:hypothetical protein
MAGQDPLVETTLSEGDFKQRLRRRVAVRVRAHSQLSAASVKTTFR